MSTSTTVRALVTRAVWPHMTVHDNVAFGLSLRKRPRQEVCQRVEWMLDLVGLSGLGERYPNQLSDRVVVFHNGVLQQYGPPREVHEQSANLFVSDFMGLVNKLSGRVLEASSGRARVTLDGERTLQAVVRNGHIATAAEVTLAVRPEAIGLSRAQPAGGNVLQGTVAEATFPGNLMDYQVDLVGCACGRRPNAPPPSRSALPSTSPFLCPSASSCQVAPSREWRPPNPCGLPAA